MFPRRPIGASVLGGTKRPPDERQRSLRTIRLEELLRQPVLDMGVLQELVWLGVPDDAPPHLRGECWKILLGYLPLNRQLRDSVATKKREDYRSVISEYSIDPDTAAASDARTLRQIRVDVVRTNPSGYEGIFRHARVELLMERVLFLWAVRNPASGYVQGLNDLVVPFILVFMRQLLKPNASLTENWVSSLSEEAIEALEADIYWCLTHVLIQIQDNYTIGQPGITKLVSKLEEVVQRVDGQLHAHLKANQIDVYQLSFRWMNCLLMREFPLPCIVRLWDTYIAEQSGGFDVFHAYVCAVFLLCWSPKLLRMDFQQIMLFIQKLPTEEWTTHEVESLLAEAYVLKSLFHSSPKHLELAFVSSNDVEDLNGDSPAPNVS